MARCYAYKNGLLQQPLTSVCIACVKQMDAAQQYNTNGRGYPPLLEWAKQNAQQLHAPPARQEVVITSGNNHAIDVSFSSRASYLLHNTVLVVHPASRLDVLSPAPSSPASHSCWIEPDQFSALTGTTSQALAAVVAILLLCY